MEAKFMLGPLKVVTATHNLPAVVSLWFYSTNINEITKGLLQNGLVRRFQSMISFKDVYRKMRTSFGFVPHQ